MILLNLKKSRILLNGYPMEFLPQFFTDLEMHASTQEILTSNKLLKMEQALKSNALKSVYLLWEKFLTTLNTLHKFLAKK